MEKDIDLTGVDPARWPEIRRRVAVLDEYIALWRPDADVRQEYADRLGISPSHLFLLARIWRKDRAAGALPGAKVKDRVAKASRLPARAIDLAGEVIDELGPMSRRKVVVAEVTRRCTAEGVTPPSASTLSNMMMEARSNSDTSELDPEILIDECVLKMPVRAGKTLAMPRVLLAIVLPQRRIVAVDIAFDPSAQTSLGEVMADIEKASTPGATTLPLRAPRRSTLEREIIGAVTRIEGMNKPTLAKVLGPRLGDIPVTYKLERALAADKLLRTRHSQAIDTSDATRAIMEAISSHNARMAPIPAAGFATGVNRRVESESVATR